MNDSRREIIKMIIVHIGYVLIVIGTSIVAGIVIANRLGVLR